MGDGERFFFFLLRIDDTLADIENSPAMQTTDRISSFVLFWFEPLSLPIIVDFNFQ